MLADKLRTVSQTSTTPKALAVAHTATPFITVYSWGSSGFRGTYSNPATLPTGAGNGVAFSPDQLAVAVAHDTSPRISAYPWTGSGFGTKYANPATLPAGQGQGVVERRAAPNGLGQQGRVTTAGHGGLFQPLGGFHQSHFGKLPLAARLRVLIDRHGQGAEQPHDGQHTE